MDRIESQRWLMPNVLLLIGSLFTMKEMKLLKENN